MRETLGLYLVMTDPVAGYDRCAEAAVVCGVSCLQLRMKGAPRHEVVAVAARVRAITAGTRTRFIVNDDVSIAREVDADGVHLGQDDLPIPEARRRWPVPGKWFGLSTHNAAQARRAMADAPDYIGAGPVFATPTKVVPDPVLGLAGLAEVLRESTVPTVAIGGIDATNLRQVLATGVTNYAVVRAVNRFPDPASAIRVLQETAGNLQTRCWDRRRSIP